MSLFLAVDVDADVQRAIAHIAARLRAAFDRDDPGTACGIKWVDPRHTHLTLHFFGEVGDDVAGALREAYSRALPMTPFALTLEGLGVYPPTGPARVLWLGASRGAAELSALHRLAGERIAGLHVERERRPFSPHLTLGRFRQPSRRDVCGLLPAAGDAAAGTSCVSSVTLYRSRLSPAGSTYDVLTRGPLVP